MSRLFVAQRHKLLRAMYADALPIELFKKGQDRIRRELIQAQTVLEASRLHFDAVELAINNALDVAGDLYETYRTASDLERRLMNQALFETLGVTYGPIGGARVSDAELTEPAARLLSEDLVDHLESVGTQEVALSGEGLNERDLVGRGGLEPPTDGL